MSEDGEGRDEHGGYGCSETERSHTAWMERALGAERRLEEATGLLRRAPVDPAQRHHTGWCRQRDAFLSGAPAQETEPSADVCTVHGDVRHGGEAEELRSALEELIKHDDVGTSTVLTLLDSIDARDSLAFSERLASAEAKLAAVSLEFDRLQMHHHREVGNHCVWADVVRIRRLLRPTHSEGGST